jgi:hypothetical protein
MDRSKKILAERVNDFLSWARGWRELMFAFEDEVAVDRMASSMRLAPWRVVTYVET